MDICTADASVWMSLASFYEYLSHQLAYGVGRSV